MVRNYKRKVGARQYRNFSSEDLSKACREILDKKISYREAAKKYNISLGCLFKHVKVFPKQNLQFQAPEDSPTSITQTDCVTSIPSASSTPIAIDCLSTTSNAHIPGTIPLYKPGHPTVFSALEESIFVDYLCLISEWGFPIDSFGLRKLAKGYLDSNGREVHTFKNNIPGRDWALAFLKRHEKILSQRMCQNIKYARAVTTKEDLTTYFDHLHTSGVQTIPPGNILNYDETNMVDDPKSKKMIFKRSAKRSERVMNFTKSATSVMFGCTDDGQLLPPYVVYKAEGMWSTWTIGGPPGTRYNRTKSGWFDECCFLDWFQTIVVPWCKNRIGQKMLIGDNLSSHFSGDIIKKCNELNISFICLPPNTTHLTQPLDVGVYGPLKKEWRKTLEAWKLGPGRQRPTLSKDEFPRLLNTVLDNMKEQMNKNIKSGFSATGIRPYNKEQVLKRLPNKSLANKKDSQEEKNRKEALLSSQIGTAVLEVLQELRSKKTPQGKKKRSKINVTPGKSVSLEEVVDDSGVPQDFTSTEPVKTTAAKKTKNDKRPTVTGICKKKKKENTKKQKNSENLMCRRPTESKEKKNKTKNVKKQCHNWEDSSSEDFSSVEYDDDSVMDASFGFSDLDEDLGIQELQPIPGTSTDNLKIESAVEDSTGTGNSSNAPTPGSWVVVKYASKKEIYHYFIGQIINAYDKGAEVKFLRNQGNNKFIWPPQDDYDNVPFNDIVEVLPEPRMVSSRGSGIFTFSADLSDYIII